MVGGLWLPQGEAGSRRETDGRPKRVSLLMVIPITSRFLEKQILKGLFSSNGVNDTIISTSGMSALRRLATGLETAAVPRDL